MKRSVQIFISLLAIVLLVRPFECFAGVTQNRQAMDCCLKGKCGQRAQSDDCCKNTVPDGNQIVPSKVASHAAPLAALTVDSVSVLIPELSSESPIDSLRHPLPQIALSSGTLPLLI